MHPTAGQEALWRAGLYDQFKYPARYNGTIMTMIDPRGELRSIFGHGVDVDGSDRPEIDRQQLRQILLDSIPVGRIRGGKIMDADEHKQNAGGKSTHDYTLRFRDG
ncbi:hypothetical protein FSPOR_8581 [Fusarium sporotrichioides]|uniref:Uncharacterized protein n=1 Tax=Fusarium sporotrichioides TaxID=5514 RepID=A0A395RTQ0_FUSSP|nr:hypothetical protein FSPOR_8581 [Fusarium sporotrichioides]